MIEAVIFDMDGVLIDAKDWHYEALNRALRLFGYEISRYDHLATYDGLPTSKKLHMLSLESGLPIQLHAFINEMKQAFTMEIVYARCKPRFAHEYALSSLRARGYRMVVASNSIRNTVDVMMQKARLDSYFEHRLSTEDVSQAKPHPEMYLTAMARLGLRAEQCLVVEDNINGIRAARSSGAHVLEVRDVGEVNLQNILARIGQVERGERA